MATTVGNVYCYCYDCLFYSLKKKRSAQGKPKCLDES